MGSHKLYPASSTQTLRNQRSSSWSSTCSSETTSSSTLHYATTNTNMGDLSERSSKNDLFATEEGGDDTEVLFSGDDAKLTQFSAFRFKDFDFPPPEGNQIKEALVARGTLQVYKMLGKERAAFIRCGSFVQPILPKLRVWRTQNNQFILPQPLPEKYWKIVLPDTAEYMDLELILDETCFYRNLVPPPPPSSGESDSELTSDEPDLTNDRTASTNDDDDHNDPYSSSASTLDRILDNFEDSDAASLEGPYLKDDNLPPKMIEHQPFEEECDDDATESPDSLTSASTGSTETATAVVTDNNASSSYLAPSSRYLHHHPLVPLATRNNIISSTVPLKFRPMDDDWLEITGSQIPSYSYPSPATSAYISWASQITGDLVSGSSNYISDKMDKMTLYSTSYLPRLTASHPQSHWAKHEHPRKSYIDEEHSQLTHFPDFYQQAVTVSGYMGWKLWSNVLSPWGRKSR
jgi:hypothetical protein